MFRSLPAVAFFCSGVLAAQVQLGNTVLTGNNTLLLLEFFGGIPYAEPPIGNLRLREPVLKPTLNVSTFDATHFGPACLQSPANSASSEDCLTVNIYRPTDLVRGNKLLPVMVFIHGGGFLAGSSAQYDGYPLVLKSINRGTPVIYASLNYRLGPLGFPAGAEAERNNALNLGLKDQITALQWIKKNVAAFGGDPTKMTVFGQSAGAVSVGVLLLNSGIENYVRGAILESGGAGTTFTFSASRRQNSWDTFVDAIQGCSSTSANTFDCIRSASSSSLLQATDISLAEANEQFPWAPTLDGPNGLLPELPSQMYAKGRFSRIPFISGTDLDEATLFTSNTTSSSDMVRNGIISNCTTTSDGSGGTELDNAADVLLQLYPNDPTLGSPFNTGSDTFGLSSQYKRSSAITGDLMFHSVRRLWTQTAAQAGVKAYGYLFTGPKLELAPPALGVSHGTELFYVYGLVPLAGAPLNHIFLSDKIMDYWISFVSTLDPNDGKGAQRPVWPEYSSTNPVLLELNADNIDSILDNYRANGINFLSNNAVLFRH
ncbi:hypothetical protein E1B28_002321 [Marasmius oreades]|uniref:Carboxylic ester hydrolase n=1 Tax=Marasmius oreades TaxID=181124 RepID=A0A9P7RNE5_9AGAR|nr:uncharacterized protein E1B28_002321 [Marasmius oreades]KAG7086361.1 hypothetical protein E1B28_002321 [Marasmius oreades]